MPNLNKQIQNAMKRSKKAASDFARADRRHIEGWYRKVSHPPSRKITLEDFLTIVLVTGKRLSVGPDDSLVIAHAKALDGRGPMIPQPPLASVMATRGRDIRNARMLAQHREGLSFAELGKKNGITRQRAREIVLREESQETS